MSAVLLTGATTPFGIALAHRLADDGRRVLAVGIEPSSPFDHDAIRYEIADLSRPRQVRRLLFGPARQERVETIVHSAFHRRATLVGSRVHRLNVGATRLMTRLATDHDTIQHFVFRSHAAVYHMDAAMPDLLREDQQLNLQRGAPQWLRDRVEADVDVCMKMGTTKLRVAVLRCAELFGPHLDSQIWDYLGSRVTLKAMGFDPMLELLSVEDAVEAFCATIDKRAEGIFNIPGGDTLPLSKVIELTGRLEVPTPGPLVGPLYTLRSFVRGTDFRYGINRGRFHFNGVLDGSRAKEVLGYQPAHSIDWTALRR